MNFEFATFYMESIVFENRERVWTRSNLDWCNIKTVWCLLRFTWTKNCTYQVRSNFYADSTALTEHGNKFGWMLIRLPPLHCLCYYLLGQKSILNNKHFVINFPFYFIVLYWKIQSIFSKIIHQKKNYTSIYKPYLPKL